MAEQSAKLAEELRSLKLKLSQVKMANARLDAECTSTLRGSDLAPANRLLQPVFDFSESLRERESMTMGEAMVYIADGSGLCELLLSLLRRMPWAELQHQLPVLRDGLILLVNLLTSLRTCLHGPGSVCTSQQMTAYAEAGARCVHEAAHACSCLCLGLAQSAARLALMLAAFSAPDQQSLS